MSKASAEELYRLYNEENLSQREIGERFNVGQAAVSNWMAELGVETDRVGKWSEEEKRILEQNYPGEKEKLERLLTNRTWNAIKLKAMDLGLARSQEEFRNSDEIKEKMRELAEENKIEIGWSNKAKISYILGVVHGDGYDDSKGTIGLEVKDQEFADKFMESLRIIGLNPNSKMRRGKINVWASSIELVSWLNAVENEIRDWLLNEGSPWDYIEGLYDSDGNLHPSGSPRICSYDRESKEFIQGLLTELQIESNIQQNNVWVSSSSADKFFENIDPVLERRRQ